MAIKDIREADINAVAQRIAERGAPGGPDYCIQVYIHDVELVQAYSN